MLTRLTWTRGSALTIALASASVAWAAPAGSDVGRAPTATTDLARRTQASHPADRQSSGLAPFLSGPACDVPDHDRDSGQHLGWVRTRTQAGVIGGSYGEVFFASGAGTRLVSSPQTTGTGTSMTAPGGGAADPATGGSATSPAQGTTNGQGTNGQGANGQGTNGQGTNGPATTNAGTSTTTATGGNAGANITAGGTTGARSQASLAPVGTGAQTVTPEPATLILLGTGLTAVLYRDRRRRSKK